MAGERLRAWRHVLYRAPERRTGWADRAEYRRRIRLLQRPRILVIDDDPAIQELVSAVLTLKGYEVHVSGRPEEALEQLKSSDYDLSLLDLRMPGMDGEDIFQILCQRHPKVASRVVFMTGDTASKDTRRFLTCVQRPVLIKPFHLDGLEETVAAALDSNSASSPNDAQA